MEHSKQDLELFARDVLNNPAFVKVQRDLEKEYRSRIENWKPSDGNDQLIEWHREAYFARIVKRRINSLIPVKENQSQL